VTTVGFVKILNVSLYANILPPLPRERTPPALKSGPTDPSSSQFPIHVKLWAPKRLFTHHFDGELNSEGKLGGNINRTQNSFKSYQMIKGMLWNRPIPKQCITITCREYTG
jgi:hypothetical protein